MSLWKRIHLVLDIFIPPGACPSWRAQDDMDTVKKWLTYVQAHQHVCLDRNDQEGRFLTARSPIKRGEILFVEEVLTDSAKIWFQQSRHFWWGHVTTR